MNYESVNQALEKLLHQQQIRAAYSHAMGVMQYDAATVAPKKSWAGRGQTMAMLSRIAYDLQTSPENGELLSYLEAHKDELNDVQKRQVEVLRRNLEEISRIPAEEYVAYSVLVSDAQTAWENAKNANDFEQFAPYLEKIVYYNRRFAGYYNPEMAPYDALINQFEEGLNMQTLDAFFGQLREAIVPLLAKTQQAQPIDDSFLFAAFPVDVQRKYSDYLMQVLGIDRDCCNIGETEHPFTTGFNNKDVRITTHYHENNVQFSMYSVIHEGGHALYELGTEDQYNYTVLSGGVSMGIHESQSRFYENIIGRSRAFIHAVYPEFVRLFPEQMAGISEEMLYRAVNKVEPSLIRTEADELTYPLHIMIRYEIEKQLIAGTLEVKDVPATWNRLYKEYLGVDVPSDAQGCLQDTHWSGGMIGYFPSYALGSAYGAQMLEKMVEEIGDVYGDVEKGDLSKVTAWLREKIHRHAGFVKPGALFEQVCGKFDPSCFTRYLTEKYSDLYNL